MARGSFGKLIGKRLLARRLDELEDRYDDQFRVVFDAIRALMAEEEEPRRPIGFRGE